MSSCTKKRYSGLSKAGLALLAIRAKGERAEVAIYPCNHCRCFHLTSDRKSATNKWTVLAMRALSRSAISG